MKNIKIEINLKEFDAVSELPVSIQKLMNKAHEAREKAYAPYSRFKVGAALQLKSGEIVPDETIINIILERLQQLDCVSKGWILDGFPMTQDQATAMRTVGIVPDIIVTLGIDDETLKVRDDQHESDELYDDISRIIPPWSDTDVLIEQFDGANEAEKLTQSIRTCIEKRIHGTEKGLDRMMTVVEQEFRFEEEQQRLMDLL